MAYHGVLFPNAIAATHIDSLNRSVVNSGSAIDNGMILVMSGSSATAGETEVFGVTFPVTGSPTNLWMAYQGDEVVWTGNYKGLDPDIRNFYIPAGDVLSAYKPQLGDIITLTAENFTGSYAGASYTHAMASTDGSGKFVWATSQYATGLAYKLLNVTYISLATGAIDTQRITAYRLECVGI